MVKGREKPGWNKRENDPRKNIPAWKLQIQSRKLKDKTEEELWRVKDKYDELQRIQRGTGDPNYVPSEEDMLRYREILDSLSEEEMTLEEVENEIKFRETDEEQ
jgi:hypothetical protein